MRLDPSRLFGSADVPLESVAWRGSESASFGSHGRAKSAGLGGPVFDARCVLGGGAFGGNGAIIRRYAAGDDVPLQELVAAIEQIRLVVSTAQYIAAPTRR